jgi:glyoxylase-like metal-dependent hydrolase (beta-lactamase superfamily II)
MGDQGLMIKSFSSSPKGTNVYLLISGQEAAVIDVGTSNKDIKNTLDAFGARLKYILVTHGHLSHVHSVSQVKKDMGGMVCLHQSDAELLKGADSDLEPDLLLKDNVSLKLGKTTIKVLHTPGHTMGSLCFHIREVKALFTGDTLFKGEFGRIRGPHSMGLMLRSLKRLNSVIPPKTTVYPGHGPSTTMSKEAWLDTLDNLS